MKQFELLYLYPSLIWHSPAPTAHCLQCEFNTRFTFNPLWAQDFCPVGYVYLVASRG